MLESKIFYINSEERLTGRSDNFTSRVLIPINQKFDRVCVLQASIPQSYYIVGVGSNTFVLRELGVDTTIAVPIGNYSVISFALVVKGLMTLASPNNWVYEMSFPQAGVTANTGKFNFSVTGNGVDQPSLYFPNEVHEQFGFDLLTYYPFTSNALTSVSVVSFVPETRVFIHSDIGINYDDGDTILQEIYGNNTVPLSMMSYELTTDPDAYSKKLRSERSNTYQFWLTDKNGNQLDLNGQDIMITILIYRKDNLSEMLKNFMQHQLLDRSLQNNYH